MTPTICGCPDEGPIRLCADSSARLPPHIAAALDVDVVPIGIALDGEPYDETELDTDRFDDRLPHGARATTSQPSPGRFAQAYARAAGSGAREVLSIHVARAVSGTIAAAELAALEAPIRSPSWIRPRSASASPSA